VKKILRKIKRLFDRLIGDYSDELFWKYGIYFLNNWKQGYLDDECINRPHRNIFIGLMLNDKNITKILELGCGDGVNLRRIAKKNPNIQLEGIDINKRALHQGMSILKNSNTNIKLTRKNLKDLSTFNDGEFDVIFSDATLMYIDPSNIYHVINNSIRVCKMKFFLCEQHTDGNSFYDDKWIHNYKLILQKNSAVESIKIHNISGSGWSGDWAKYGKIIEVVKQI